MKKKSSTGGGEASHKTSVLLPDGLGSAALTFDSLDERAALRFVGHASAGASVLFVGTTRDNFQGKEVVKLEYEAYSELAIKTLQRIVALACHAAGPWPLSQPLASFSSSSGSGDKSSSGTEEKTEGQGTDNNTEGQAGEQPASRRVYIAHRLGNVPVEQASILVAVSSPHRREAFEVAEWALELVKREAQIWKKEVYKGDADASQWKSNAADTAARAAAADKLP